MLTLKILRYSLEIKPQLAIELKAKFFPLVICKFFEDFRYGTFEERFEVFYKAKFLFYLFFNNFFNF